jgi:hypothetical protein
MQPAPSGSWCQRTGSCLSWRCSGSPSTCVLHRSKHTTHAMSAHTHTHTTNGRDHALKLSMQVQQTCAEPPSKLLRSCCDGMAAPQACTHHT